jgi:hypothetical protein
LENLLKVFVHLFGWRRPFALAKTCNGRWSWLQRQRNARWLLQQQSGPTGLALWAFLLGVSAILDHSSSDDLTDFRYSGSMNT